MANKYVKAGALIGTAVGAAIGTFVVLKSGSVNPYQLFNPKKVKYEKAITTYTNVPCNENGVCCVDITRDMKPGKIYDVALFQRK